MKVNEVELIQKYSNKDSTVVSDKPIDVSDKTLMGKVKGHSIYFDKTSIKDYGRFYVVNDKNQVMLTVDGHLVKKKSVNVFYIDRLSGRKGSPVKAHEFYRALMLQNPVILVTSAQSYGGLKVWQKLAAYSDITVFGYNNGKSYNVDPREPEDTHVDHEEYVSADPTDASEISKIYNMQLVAHRKNMK